MPGISEGEGVFMSGVPLLSIGLYIIMAAALGIEPTVSGGMVCSGLGLILIIINLVRGNHD